MDFHSKTVKETAKILGTSLTKGLEPTEVVNRLNEYGKNKLSQAKKTPIIIQFRNLLIADGRCGNLLQGINP